MFFMFHLRHLIKLLCWPGTFFFNFYTVVISVSFTDVFLLDTIYCSLLLSKASSPLFAIGRNRSENFDRRFAGGLINVLFNAVMVC
jgi:hypothetical protein